MNRSSLALCLLFAVSSLEAKEPLTHEKLWLMERVGAPSLSPDGRWAAFSVTEPAYDTKQQSSDVWIVPSDGSAAPRRITYSKSAESGLTWSEDSRRLAFSAKRDGDEQNQIYVLDVAGGGEAQRVTSVSSGARSPQFSPDGKTLLFFSSVYRDARDDEANKQAEKAAKERKANVRVYESFPIRSWDRWIDPDKQLRLFVQPLDGPGTARDLLAGTRLAAEAGYSGNIGGEAGESIDAVWSPDGRWIVFAVTTARHAAAYSQIGTDLYRVSVAGGEPERLHGDGSQHGDPAFSPDGRTLFSTYEPNNGKTYNLARIVAFDWPSMRNRRVLNTSTDRSVESFELSPDGRTVYFTAEDEGLIKLYAMPAVGGEVSLAVDPRRGVYTGLDVAGSATAPVIVALWGSSVNPAELVRVDPATKSHRLLTNFNVQEAAAIDWQPPQHFWFNSSRGKRIHNMLVLPPAFDPARKYPLFVLIHGGAHNMWADNISLRWNYHLLSKPGYVLLLTNYTGSTGFGEKFAQEIQGDPLRGPAQEINEAADEAIRRFPFIDGSRQVAGGASYGGHLVNWLLGTTDRYRALISHAGMVNPESQWGTSDVIYGRELAFGGPVWEQNPVWREQNAMRLAANFKTPTLVSIGEKDYRVPLNNSLELWAALQRMRVPSRLLVWPEENHWILNPENSRRFYQEVADWIARWINTPSGTNRAATTGGGSDGH